MIIKVGTLHSPLPAGVLAAFDDHFDSIETWLKGAGAEKVWLSTEDMSNVVIMANFPALKDPTERATPRELGGKRRKP